MTHTLRFISVLWIVCVVWVLPGSAQTITLATATGGATVSGPNPAGAVPVYHSGFGNVNGLGIGTPATGLTKLAVSGGYFYYTPYSMVLSGANNGHPARVQAYLSTNFSNPTTVFQLMSCASPGACNTFASYSNMPTTQATDILVLPRQTAIGTFTAYLGLFVANTNGIAITSGDSAVLTFTIYDDQHGNISQVQLKLDTPTLNDQTAVQLQLATAASGITITAGAGSPDFTANFGTVNALAVGIASPFTKVTAAGGVIYGTPYLLQPAFSGFSSANSTKISAYISTDFVHSAVLTLYDSASQSSGYSAISKNSGSPTVITNAASNGNSITEYLGLFISNINGASSFRGSDNATLTYTITVQ